MQDEGAVADTPSVADRVLHSDPHDFAGLYIRHRASFTLHARRYLRDARDADEVVQEAFLRLFLALPELETELQALAYCRRTITNLCIDRFRAQARRPSLVDLDSAGAMDLAEDDPGDPVVRAEDAAMVRAALSLLSPLHRAALVKREIEEKPVPVIAAELDIPEESVKHVLFRARRALRRILASTSLAPGSDAELAGALGKAARASSGGLAAFLLLLVLGLGTGPDLRAIPVVGADFPELIPVTEIAHAVGDAVTTVATSVADGVAGAVTASGGGSAVEAQPAPDAAVPLPVAEPSPSPSAVPAAVMAVPVSSAAPVAATPAAAATPESSPVGPPSPSAAPSVLEQPSPRASSAPSPAPEQSSSAEPTASPEPGAAPPERKSSRKPRSSPSPSPSTAQPQAQDPEAYQTDGLEYVLDEDGETLVLVPLGQTSRDWRG